MILIFLNKYLKIQISGRTSSPKYSIKSYIFAMIKEQFHMVPLLLHTINNLCLLILFWIIQFKTKNKQKCLREKRVLKNSLKNYKFYVMQYLLLLFPFLFLKITIIKHEEKIKADTFVHQSIGWPKFVWPDFYSSNLTAQTPMFFGAFYTPIYYKKKTL